MTYQLIDPKTVLARVLRDRGEPLEMLTVETVEEILKVRFESDNEG